MGKYKAYILKPLRIGLYQNEPIKASSIAEILSEVDYRCPGEQYVKIELGFDEYKSDFIVLERNKGWWGPTLPAHHYESVEEISIAKKKLEENPVYKLYLGEMIYSWESVV